MSTQIDPERDRNFISLQSRPKIEKARRMDSSHMEKITVDSQIHFGKPCIAGTRIPVQSILELLDEGLSFTGTTNKTIKRCEL
ncbi:DUF433 domain-containing protein [Lyngbya sp. CCY1209]|uniref:DUF433 domain-containing protein n=1 Tax=Lyngbya sp. CCY1209 TaxID=2886103 RepID=UPI002D2105A4|nr:DUF433 domain-containing protein [Lyngbya sp. CCY1209]MEB3882731.1 DUF433 domain-containing protein [Lyngbya sp. CCY1209]